ncbi:MAG TPA: TIGR00725 family protein [Actinomycetota bacterium]
MPPDPAALYVAVVGPGVASHEEEAWAEEVGRLLARAGAVVVCGGSTGVMEAACRGAADAGGTSMGILPGFDRGEANPYVTFAIPTGMGEMRNALIARSADSVIAVGGEFGTLSEIAFALKIGRPVVGLRTWELVRRGEPVPGIHAADTPAEAVASALRLAGRS